MKFYKHLYVSKNITKDNLFRIKWKLKHNAGMFGIFVITLAQGNDQLEIWDSAYLQQPYYKNKDILVLGIAKGKDEATELIQKMILETFHHTGSFKVKEYIMQFLHGKGKNILC